MTSSPDEHDQDSEPPTPDGQEPDTTRLDPDSEPGSHPDPPPDAPGSLGGDNGGG
jgi:hypothetical protein